MRIVQLANMYHARSGGLRTVVDTLGRGYIAAGHERFLIVPGARPSIAADERDGTVITVPGTPVSGGYRMIFRPERVLRILAALAPDSIEVSDKATLASETGPWARARGVRAVLFSHERLDAMVANRTGIRTLPRSVERAVGRWNRRVVAGFDDVVTTSAFGERELTAAGATGIRRVPLGVDLEVFRPHVGGLAALPPVEAAAHEFDAAREREHVHTRGKNGSGCCGGGDGKRHDGMNTAARLRAKAAAARAAAQAAANGAQVSAHIRVAGAQPEAAERAASAAAHTPIRLVYSGRLSTEKNPRTAVEALRVLRQWGVDAVLDVYGSGPQDASLKRRAAALPVTFHGYLGDRSRLASKLAHADLVLAPAACETFGLSVLEALACGVAVVAASSSGAAELVSPGPGGARPGAGIAVEATACGVAGGVIELLGHPARERAEAARARASQYPWSAAVGRMLAIHGGAGDGVYDGEIVARELPARASAAPIPAALLAELD
ncbi:MAG: glycosyltransferase [Actinocrinis sp.]